jgi:predicted alpha-1,6-mannanase (GH76 family)
MDNVTSSPAFPNTCVIKLDQHQYTFYKKSRLEIQSPKGRVLAVMSKPLTNKTEADAVFQLWCQACLLEVLFSEIQDKIKLPQKAINNIANVIDRIDLHLKKQSRM